MVSGVCIKSLARNKRFGSAESDNRNSTMIRVNV